MTSPQLLPEIALIATLISLVSLIVAYVGKTNLVRAISITFAGAGTLVLVVLSKGFAIAF